MMRVCVRQLPSSEPPAALAPFYVLRGEACVRALRNQLQRAANGDAGVVTRLEEVCVRAYVRAYV